MKTGNFNSQIIMYLLFIELNVKLGYCWRMQLCVNGSYYETSSEICKHGIWFTVPMIVHKFCFEHGLWAIYKEFCEENPLIWSVLPGRQGCIGHDILGKRVIGIISLGNDENSGAILATSGRRLFLENHKLKHGMRLTFVNEPATIEVLTWGPPAAKFSLHQRVNNDQGILQQCLIKEERAFFGYYKLPIENPANASIYLAKNVCNSPLNRQTGNGGRRVQALPVEIDFNIFQSVPEQFEEELKCEKYAKVDDVIDKDLNDVAGLMAVESEGKILPKSIVHNIEHRVYQETQKLALRLVSYHFNNDKFNQNFDTLRFLNLSLKILSKVCPSHMLSSFFVEEMYLLFQAMLEVNSQLFPTRLDRDEITTTRIRHKLQYCLENSTEFEFRSPKNCSSEVPLLKQVFPNGTKYHLLIEMPGFLKIDYVNYDLLMESIWKIMNFPHYHCAEYFREHSTDHSVLLGRWMQMFSPLIVRRWKYPGRSYLVFKKIFRSINLERNVRNLDFCVSAARYHSSYKGWLKRPVVHWYKEKSSSSRFNDSKINPISIWDNMAYCISDYMDPALKFPQNVAIERCGILPPQQE